MTSGELKCRAIKEEKKAITVKIVGNNPSGQKLGAERRKWHWTPSITILKITMNKRMREGGGGRNMSPETGM